MIRIVKNTMKKCDDTKQDLQLALLSLRTTPISGTLPSPAELLNNRQMKSTLPLVSRNSRNDETATEELRRRQEMQKTYYDRVTAELPPLKSGQPVMIQELPSLHWKPGTVVSPTKEPRSYVVQDTDGARYRRNRKFIKELPSHISIPVESHTDDLTLDPSPGPSTDSEPPTSPKSAKPTDTTPGPSTNIEPPASPKSVKFTNPTRRSTREHKTPARLICEM